MTCRGNTWQNRISFLLICSFYKTDFSEFGRWVFQGYVGQFFLPLQKQLKLYKRMHLYCLFSTQVNVLLLSLTEAEGW